MATFDTFLESIRKDERGWQLFEHFSKWFLEHDPYWSREVSKVWLWDDWPGRWGPDSGIDLIFEHVNGEVWAVQSKFYSSDNYVKKSDIDSFLSESSRKEIQHRLLLSTTDKIGTRAKKTIRDQEKPVTVYGLDSFQKSSLVFPASFKSLNKAKPKELPDPRPHQERAIADVARGFKKSDRGQLIMACGTGKTYTTLWIKESISADLTLVLLPSLSLLSQTMNEWVAAANSSFRVLNVCSDETVGNRDVSMALDSAPFAVTSDVSVIRAFMKAPSPGVIFSTYQSSPLIAEAQRLKSLPEFDLAVADEAHRCVGKSGSAFTTVLDDKAIRASKRLFTTATPRFYSKQVTTQARNYDIELIGMDNEQVFGKRFHTLTFGEAIERKLLSDYQVVLVGVDDERVKEFIEHRVKLDTGGVVQDAESLSAQIAILKALEKYNLNRVITFHSRVSSAKQFSEDLPRLMTTHEDLIETDYSLWADYVSGKHNAHQRKQTIDVLRHLPDSDKGLLANAKCLSEGVDVPSLDGVAFVDPRSSQVDIIQAVGRAIRLSDNKTNGTIILPVFISSTEDHEVALNDSSFKSAWEVIKALRAHDEVLADTLDKCRTELGKKGKRIDKSLSDKLIIDLPSSVPSGFFEAIETKLVESTTASWGFWFGLLEKYVEENGDALVPIRYETSPKFKLGQWVVAQRKRFATLPESRISRLNSIGFVWDVEDHRWNEMFSELEQHVKKNGDTRVHQNYKTSFGANLGTWVSSQRVKFSSLSESRKARLNSLGFISNTREADWEEMFSELERYVQKHGNAIVPKREGLGRESALGKWVSAQRLGLSNISEARKSRLNAIGFVWDVNTDRWDKMFSELECYVREHGSTIVPINYQASDGSDLGGWVSKCRRRANVLSESRKSKLNAIGFVWDVAEEEWTKTFSELKLYVKENGDAHVPQGYETSSRLKLGRWVADQRKRFKKSKLSDSRIERLNALGFVWQVKK
jgi:superfamily II DNA or RNA helicase